MQFAKTMVALSIANHLHIPISISQSYACCFGGSTTTIFDTYPPVNQTWQPHIYFDDFPIEASILHGFPS
jgi:hypothetical protein